MKPIKIRSFIGGNVSVHSSVQKEQTVPLLLHNCYPDNNGFILRRSDTESILSSGVLGVYEDQDLGAYIDSAHGLYVGGSLMSATARGQLLGESFYFLRLGDKLYVSSESASVYYTVSTDMVSLWDIRPMENLCFFRGSIWGSYGNYVKSTIPTRPTEEDLRGFIDLEEPVMLVCATAEYLVAATRRAHYLISKQDTKLAMKRALNFGAFKGSAAYFYSNEPMWLTERGVASASNNGIQIANINGVRLPLHGRRVHAAVDDIDGVLQYVALTPVVLNFKDSEIQSVLNDVITEDLGG